MLDTQALERIFEHPVVVLIGVSGSGKSTLCKSLFEETEVLSTDRYRQLTADSSGELSATPEALILLNIILSARCRRGLRSVVDSTGLEAGFRAMVLDTARKYRRKVIALAVQCELSECASRQKTRLPEAQVNELTIGQQFEKYKRTMAEIRDEPFSDFLIVRSTNRSHFKGEP